MDVTQAESWSEGTDTKIFYDFLKDGPIRAAFSFILICSKLQLEEN